MKIFISHSSKDQNFGNLVVELLRNLGVKETDIIFTSNVAYGIPVGQNIFHWLKSQIEEKPFVIYLLSEHYYESVACLNEMGAAWIVENEHAALFTPDFDLTSKEFQNGALDPREIGFYINSEERTLSFIQQLSDKFELSRNTVLIAQSVKKFIQDVEKMSRQPKTSKGLAQIVTLTREEIPEQTESQSLTELNIQANAREKESPYTKFLKTIASNRLKPDELLLLHYMVDTTKIRLMTGWQIDNEVSNIQEWEKINDIKDLLSKNYPSTLNRFELRGFTEVSDLTSYGNPKEVILKEEIATNILDLPVEVLLKIEKVVRDNFYVHKEQETDEEDDLPF